MSRSVQRALSILELFSAAKKEWGITEISQELDLPKSTVHGLVKTLEHRQYLQVTAGGKYRLGIKVFELGHVYSNNLDLTAAAEPAVKFLLDKYKEAVHMAIYAGRAAVFIVSTKADKKQVIFPQVGTGASAYCTAVGKVLLAWQSDEHIEEYLRTEELRPVTKNTITDPDLLYQELMRIRQEGYAVDRGEALTDTACIAAPIFSSSGQVIAAISVSGTKEKMLDSKIFTDCCRDVIQAAKTVTRDGFLLQL